MYTFSVGLGLSGYSMIIGAVFNDKFVRIASIVVFLGGLFMAFAGLFWRIP
jgi:hypothetical protein